MPQNQPPKEPEHPEPPVRQILLLLAGLMALGTVLVALTAQRHEILPILFRGEMIALVLWALSTIIALLAKIERNTRR